MGEVFRSREEIAVRVDVLGREIAADYAGRDLLLVVVLRGAFVFAADLSRAIPIAHALDFVSLAAYGGPLRGSGAVRLLKDLDAPIAGRHVLVVENLVDTGLTLNYLLKALSLREPADTAVCTLLDRPYRRLVDDLPIRYVGFTAPDEFFVGYGFAFDGRYRGLPDVRALAR
ncbi:MAG TPA: hypoxanthine phosphoribosyltransferase [Gaiellaceae bacterium]|nr:hypoxanthine phosphoribosyltransferase [Gaiellaceae bacterium]